MKSHILVLLTAATFNLLPSSVQAQTSSQKPPKTETEMERLTLVLTKYGNNPEGTSALLYAILQNDEPAVDLLLRYGASPFAKDCKNRNCLYYAIKAGNFELFKMFIQLGVDPNDDCYSDEYKPLAVAIQFHQNDIAELLIKLGCDRLFNEYGGISNVMQRACYHGNFALFKTLLEENIPGPEEYARFARVAMSHQAKGDAIKILEYLGDRGLINAQDVVPGPNMSPEALVYLINNKIVDPKCLPLNALHMCVLDAPEIAKILLEYGADPNSFDSHRRTPLMELARRELSRYEELIQVLLDHGADINAKDDSGKRALNYATSKEMIQFLKSHGAK